MLLMFRFLIPPSVRSIIGLGEFEGTEPGTGKGKTSPLRAGFCFEPALKELSEQAAKAAITANSAAPIEKDFFLASKNIPAS
jgi:hypothetical protein